MKGALIGNLKMLSPLTNQNLVLGTTLRAVGNERCVNLVRRIILGAEPLVDRRKQYCHLCNLTDANDNPNGEMATARKEGSRRNWGGPPGPGEKNSGAG